MGCAVGTRFAGTRTRREHVIIMAKRTVLLTVGYVDGSAQWTETYKENDGTTHGLRSEHANVANWARELVEHATRVACIWRSLTPYCRVNTEAEFWAERSV